MLSATWRDLPGDFAAGDTIDNCFRRWASQAGSSGNRLVIGAQKGPTPRPGIGK